MKNSKLSLLINKGFINYDINEKLSETLVGLLVKSNLFFKESNKFKESFVLEKSISGYRSIGMEYSKDVNTPDLCESFSYRETDSHKLNSTIPQYTFIESLSETHKILDSIVQNILENIANELNVNAKIPSDLNSYLQVSYYNPIKYNRELLLEEHEDGSMLTRAVQFKFQHKQAHV